MAEWKYTGTKKEEKYLYKSPTCATKWLEHGDENVFEQVVIE